MKPKSTEPPKTLGECKVGDVAETPCGTLLVTGAINGFPLVRLYSKADNRTVSQPFGVRADVPVMSVSRKPNPRPPAAAGNTYDPVSGGGGS